MRYWTWWVGGWVGGWEEEEEGRGFLYHELVDA